MAGSAITSPDIRARLFKAAKTTPITFTLAFAVASAVAVDVGRSPEDAVVGPEEHSRSGWLKEEKLPFEPRVIGVEAVAEAVVPGRTGQAPANDAGDSAGDSGSPTASPMADLNAMRPAIKAAPAADSGRKAEIGGPEGTFASAGD
jgi:hypothetical protein